MKNYAIVDENGVIRNIITGAAAYAKKIGALPVYDGAAIGGTYSPAAPAQQREEAYNTQPSIEYAGQTLTVTQAAQLWQYYAAEGNAKAGELQGLIAAAKQAIREQFPDEEATE